MYSRSESFFSGYDGTQLFLQKWRAENTKGYILINHGQAEHSECYSRLINGLAATGWSFIGWDLRGHGRSQGIRGYAKDFDEYVLDYQIFLENCFKLPEIQNLPIVLLGHSMGGLIQTSALSEKKNLIADGQILSSPFFGVAITVPEWKDKGAGLINSFLPKITLSNEIKNDQLTRDIEIMREYEQDTYRHNRISSGVYLGFKREFQKIISRAADISLPTLMHISDNDPIVSSENALRFFEGLPNSNKVLKVVEGGKHELYNDIVRVEIFNLVAEFIKQFEKK